MNFAGKFGIVYELLSSWGILHSSHLCNVFGDVRLYRDRFPKVLSGFQSSDSSIFQSEY
jgi:hypothetical protein